MLQQVVINNPQFQPHIIYKTYSIQDVHFMILHMLWTDFSGEHSVVPVIRTDSLGCGL